MKTKIVTSKARVFVKDQSRYQINGILIMYVEFSKASSILTLNQYMDARMKFKNLCVSEFFKCTELWAIKLLNINWEAIQNIFLLILRG